MSVLWYNILYNILLTTALSLFLLLPAGHTATSERSSSETSRMCPWGGSNVSTLARRGRPVSGPGPLIWAELQTRSTEAWQRHFKCLLMPHETCWLFYPEIQWTCLLIRSTLSYIRHETALERSKNLTKKSGEFLSEFYGNYHNVRQQKCIV